MAADWTESGRYAGREMQDYERISNSDGGKEKPQRKTHGLRLRIKRDVVPHTEWHFVFRRWSNDRNHKSPQVQKTPVWRPKRWNLADKRPRRGVATSLAHWPVSIQKTVVFYQNRTSPAGPTVPAYRSFNPERE